MVLNLCVFCAWINKVWRWYDIVLATNVVVEVLGWHDLGVQCRSPDEQPHFVLAGVEQLWILADQPKLRYNSLVGSARTPRLASLWHHDPRACFSRRMWWKHEQATLFTCRCIDSWLSSVTPRSRTVFTGDAVRFHQFRKTGFSFINGLCRFTETDLKLV